jgi:phosphatidylinositol alpha-1,6-mannosyltransferase
VCWRGEAAPVPEVGAPRGERDIVDVPRTLVVTNDFPPRVGGVQQYIWNLVRNLPADRVAVLAPNWPGWREHDQRVPFPVHRWPARFLWPTPELGRRVRSLVREHRAQVVLFGHGYPLPLMAPDLEATGIPSVVLTHGAEVWLARTPAVAASMRWALGRARAVTVVSRWTAHALERVLPSEVPRVLLHPGVDPVRFNPKADGGTIRAAHSLDGRAVVLCVSRLVPRKGQDVLIAGMTYVRERVPDAVLMVVGDGPYRGRLEELATQAPTGSVVFVGAVPDQDLLAYYASCDLFAMPCRSRWGGLEVEGFGIVYLEAAAAGKAVVAGRSGGAEEAVEDGVTGLLVEGAEPKAVALAVARLLRDPAALARMGSAGRQRVEREFTWARQSNGLESILREATR